MLICDFSCLCLDILLLPKYINTLTCFISLNIIFGIRTRNLLEWLMWLRLFMSGYIALTKKHKHLNLFYLGFHLPEFNFRDSYTKPTPMINVTSVVYVWLYIALTKIHKYLNLFYLGFHLPKFNFRDSNKEPIRMINVTSVVLSLDILLLPKYINT